MKTRRNKSIGPILQPFSISAEPDSSTQDTELTVAVLLLLHQVLFPPLIGSMPLLNQHQLHKWGRPCFQVKVCTVLLSCSKDNILLS